MMGFIQTLKERKKVLSKDKWLIPSWFNLPLQWPFLGSPTLMHLPPPPPVALIWALSSPNSSWLRQDCTPSCTPSSGPEKGILPPLPIVTEKTQTPLILPALYLCPPPSPTHSPWIWRQQGPPKHWYPTALHHYKASQHRWQWQGNLAVWRIP
jgi:hypothetical protein